MTQMISVDAAIAAIKAIAPAAVIDTRTDNEVIQEVTAKIAAVMAPAVDWAKTTAAEMADLLTRNSYGIEGGSTSLDERTGAVTWHGSTNALPAYVIEGKIICDLPVTETERAFYKASRAGGDWGPYSTQADLANRRILVTRNP